MNQRVIPALLGMSIPKAVKARMDVDDVYTMNQLCLSISQEDLSPGIHDRVKRLVTFSTGSLAECPDCVLWARLVQS